MTNQEKYKTAKEREDEFRQFCKSHRVCEACPLFEVRRAYNAYSFQYGCLLKWLEIEVEEELLPCPFCNGTPLRCHDGTLGVYYVRCCDCGSMTKDFTTKDEAIAAWDRRAK